MRKFIIPLAISLFFSLNTTAQFVSIPDTILRNYIKLWHSACFNASNMLDTSCTSLMNLTDFSDPYPGVQNWDGFQYLKNIHSAHFGWSTTLPPVFPNTLKWLEITNTNITSIPSLPVALDTLIYRGYGLTVLPSLPSTLKYLRCSGTQISALPSPLPASLKYMDCQSNHLTVLPDLPGQLEFLYLYHNELVNLPALPASLKMLDVSYNQITAIPAFPAGMQSFSCRYNNVVGTLPAFPSTLVDLDCASNQLTQLPSFPSSLVTLDCSQNQIAILPSVPVTVLRLNCSNNLIPVIPSLPPGLTYFVCAGNSLTALPALPNTITIMDCSWNQLTTLPQLPGQLKELYTGYNQITSLPELPSPLLYLECSSNLLTSIPALPSLLQQFICVSNQLTSLPQLPHQLDFVDCSENQITSLPAVPNTVTIFQCFHNPLTCLPAFIQLLPSEGLFLNMSVDNVINCIPNMPYESYWITKMDASTPSGLVYYDPVDNPIPICNPTNNCNHCHSYPWMKGHVYNDNNNNNIKDAGEPFRPNFRIQLSNGVYTLTDNNGYYEIMADSLGDYTLGCTAPNLFNVVPPQYNYHFSTYDTVIVNDFACQPTIIVDSLDISITAINASVRLGRPFPYLITYENTGTTTLSPNIVFNYDNTKLIYDSSSNPAVTNNGTSLQLTQPSMTPGEQKSFIGYFVINPLAFISDTIHVHATIAGGSASDADSTACIITGSYDPNDKSATPALSPAEVSNGNYVDYVIRFQNVGNDTALDVVIADTLSSYLQSSTLNVINASHICKTTVKDNIVYFEFINILLPDSNVNELKSHGFVSFRVQPQADVTLSTNIPNTASIYFDFNSPVVTNTAVTQIIEPIGPVPLKLLSFTATRQTKNTANVYWSTANEFNTGNFIIESSTDARNYSGIASESAKGGTYNTYVKTISIPSSETVYLRLKMLDVDGRFTYSQVAILKDNKTSEPFTLLNNPAKDELGIAVDDAGLKNTIARVISSSGAVMKTFVLKNDIEYVDIKQLSSGTYVLKTIKGSRQFVIVK